MKVLVIGANGKIGQHVVKKLQDSGKHEALAMVRQEEQATKYKAQGVETVLADLEGDIADIISAAEKADAVVFTAGSGGHTGADKTMMVDFDGAIKAMDAAKKAGVQRFIIVSAIGVHKRDNWMSGAPYYSAAKHYADVWLRESGLDYTIIRPGRLTNDPGKGKIKVDVNLDRDEIPREDVAAAIVAVLDAEHTIGKDFDMVQGHQSIEKALQSL